MTMLRISSILHVEYLKTFVLDEKYDIYNEEANKHTKSREKINIVQCFCNPCCLWLHLMIVPAEL